LCGGFNSDVGSWINNNIDGWVGYVEMDFEFKCDWKCESTVCFLIGMWIGRVIGREIRTEIDIPLDTNVDVANFLALDLFPFVDDLVPIAVALEAFLAAAFDPFESVV